MKKVILSFLLGIILSGSVVYASVFYGRDVSYDNTNSHLVDENNQNVTNVQDAIDVLYDKANKGGETYDSQLINNVTTSPYTITSNLTSIDGISKFSARLMNVSTHISSFSISNNTLIVNRTAPSYGRQYYVEFVKSSQPLQEVTQTVNVGGGMVAAGGINEFEFPTLTKVVAIKAVSGTMYGQYHQFNAIWVSGNKVYYEFNNTGNTTATVLPLDITVVGY